MASIEKLKHLVNLALIDGEIGEKERNYIINIGQANHLMVAEILPLFSREYPVKVPEVLTEEQKFDYIFPLVQLMKIDEKLFREEIKYCSQVAAKLGYREEVMFELMLKVKNTPMVKNELDALKKLTASYLRSS